MSSVHAVTEDLKFEARIASFYELSNDASLELVNALSKVFEEHGKKHGYLVWRVQILREPKEKNT
jgi:hypothetical protein